MVTVALRVDASVDIGTGHVVRCLTLANAFKAQGARTLLACRHLPETLGTLVRKQGHSVIRVGEAGQSEEPVQSGLPHALWLGVSQAQDAADTIEALAGETPDWLVVDHYALDAQWQRVLRRHCKQLMVIDDLADRAHDCDLLLDQNYYQDLDTRYSGKLNQGCHTLLGPRYALLRTEFLAHRPQGPRSGQVARVLVFFGGVDARNHTHGAVQALAALKLRDVKVDVVVGAQHPQLAQIQAACGQQGFELHVQTSRMAELMAAADLALGAGGTASWERCCLGLPTLAVITADNQRRLVEDAAAAGLIYGPAFSLGFSAQALEVHLRALLDNPRLLRACSQKGLETVDGRGVQRVLRAMGLSEVSIRPATAEDSDKLYFWRNHLDVRKVSRSTEPIARATHENWLQGVLANADRPLLIGYIRGQALGVVRFDIQGDEAEVSIYLVPGSAVPATGGDLLQAAEEWLREHRGGVRRVVAQVLGGNLRSQYLFLKGGYALQSAQYCKSLY